MTKDTVLATKVLEGTAKHKRITSRLDYYSGVDMVLDWINDRLNM